jgi:hypothetical protein
MISIRRWQVAGIPLIFLFYLPIPSLLIPSIADREIEILALVIYLALGVVSTLFYQGLKIPAWLAMVNMIFAVVAPQLIILEREISAQENIGGWLVTGVSIILTATAVRQHRWLALLGFLFLAAEMVIKYGPIAIVSQGLIGALVFILAGLGVSSGIKRATADSDRYREQQAQSLASIAATEAAQTARTLGLQEVLRSAIPTLERIAKATEPLSAEEKMKAKFLELALRDEIRGKGLLTPAVRAEVARLRNLGVEVALLDEGGLDELTDKQKKEIFDRAIAELQIVSGGRVTIRSPKNETFKLTVVATMPGQPAPILNIKL